MIYITGDTHGDWQRFSTDNFPEQKHMTRDDFVIVCGDFGIWHNDKTEQWWFKWFDKKNFTVLFVDGNHENFDRLYSNEFEVVDFHGGKSHKIRDNVYHLMRGYIYELCGKKFFAFGGAKSHDIDDGILDPKDYPSHEDLIKDYSLRSRMGEMIRINHMSWWKEEMPSQKEMDFGLETLRNNSNEVDFIITHCCPRQIAPLVLNRSCDPDDLTSYLDIIMNSVKFSKWFFGHYHTDENVLDKFAALYKEIIRIV